MSGWVEAFIAVATIAIVIQMAILLAMFLQVRIAIEKFTKIASDLQIRIDPILVRTNRILEDSEERISSIMGDAAEISRTVRGQAQKVDRVLTDTMERVEIHIVRADQILTGALEVIDQAGTRVRESIWEPVHKASAILKAVKAGIDFMRGQQQRRQNKNGDPVNQDEELFI